MNKQHAPLYLALIFVITVGVYLIYEFKVIIPPNRTPALAKQDIAMLPPGVSNVSRHESTAFARTDVDYPRFSGELSALNAPIEKLINDGIAAHNKNSADNWQARVSTADPAGSVPNIPPVDERFPYHATWSLTQFDSERVSVLMQYDEFSGGAHGSESSVTYNYDMKAHKLMTIADLFPHDPMYLEKLSKIVVDALIADRKSATGEPSLSDYELKWIGEGAGPKAENFATFTTHENRLTLYFAQYQVGPYAIGMPKIEVPLPLQ